MTGPTPDYFVRRGFDAEMASHRREATRSLQLVRQHLDAALSSLDGEEVSTYDLRQLVVDAAEAAERGFALWAVQQVAKFARPEEG